MNFNKLNLVRTGRSGVRGKISMCRLSLMDQSIDSLDELFACRMGTAQQELLRVSSEDFLPGGSRPPAEVAVHQERESAEVPSPSRIPELRQDVLQTVPKPHGIVHAALQHG